jgi:hypothetical protein
MKILISSSMKFKDKFIETKKELESMGFDVELPEYTSPHSTKREHIDKHLEKLKKCDALLLTNYIDDTGYGYVGASGFIEVGWAFALGKYIYLLNMTNPNSPYTEDLDAVVYHVIDGDLNKLIGECTDIIEKKIWPEYFQKIKDGTKKFELRLANFPVKEGDKLILKEWAPDTEQYTGRELEKTVSYVLKTKDVTFWSQKEINRHGFQIISFD